MGQRLHLSSDSSMSFLPLMAGAAEAIRAQVAANGASSSVKVRSGMMDASILTQTGKRQFGN